MKKKRKKEECPKLLSGLGIGHRGRQSIPMWNSSGCGGIIQGITVYICVTANLQSMVDFNGDGHVCFNLLLGFFTGIFYVFNCYKDHVH